MNQTSDHLVLLVLGAVDRTWETTRHDLERLTGMRVTDNLEAKAQWAMAALALSIGTGSSDSFRENVSKSLAIRLGPYASDLEESFRRYDRICRRWPDLEWDELGCKFRIPPLKSPHELLAIMLIDCFGLDEAATHEMSGEKYYNLFFVGSLGGQLLRIANSVREIG